MASVVKKKDVLTRLDSLLQRAEKATFKEAKNLGSLTPAKATKGILRAERSKKAVKRSIRFPDSTEDLQEVIGYGGTDKFDSDSEDDFSSDDDTKGPPSPMEELTVEERNLINLTKKNTNFNAHSQNLTSDENRLMLGAEKKAAPPLITVRPFVQGALSRQGQQGEPHDQRRASEKGGE